MWVESLSPLFTITCLATSLELSICTLGGLESRPTWLKPCVRRSIEWETNRRQLRSKLGFRREDLTMMRYAAAIGAALGLLLTFGCKKDEAGPSDAVGEKKLRIAMIPKGTT